MYIDSTSLPIIYLDIGTLTIICSIQKSPPIVSLGKGPSGGGLRPRDRYLFFSLILVPGKAVTCGLVSKRPKKCNFLFIPFPFLRSSDRIWLQLFWGRRVEGRVK